MSQDSTRHPADVPYGTRTMNFPVPGGGGTQLVVVEGPTPGLSFPLKAATCTLGRHQGCTIVLSSITVSRQHATITRQADVFYVVDNQSSNGVYLNGQKLQPGQSCPLHNGDMIRLGEFLLLFKNDEKAPASLGLSAIDLDADRIRREVDDFLKDMPIKPADSPTQKQE